MISKETLVVRSEQYILATDVDDEVVLLNLEKGNYYTLDLVGADIWRMLDKPIAVSEIIMRIVQEYDVSAEKAEADVLFLLQDLEQEGLIEVHEDVAAMQDNGVASRRFNSESQELEEGEPGTKRGFLARFAKITRRWQK